MKEEYRATNPFQLEYSRIMARSMRAACLLYLTGQEQEIKQAKKIFAWWGMDNIAGDFEAEQAIKIIDRYLKETS